MVKRMIVVLAGVLMILASQASAQSGQLVVEPDRTRLYEGEVLTLTVKGSMKLEVNLSNLFDFDLSQLPAPDIGKVEPDFEILAQNQRYSIRTINNEMVGEITWTYQLAPTRTGTLTIPALSFKGAQSEPIDIDVVSGSPPGQPAASRDSFIELSADKAEVYVQEQLTLTVKLFFTGNLIRGELSEPEHPDAIIEPLGKQREYARFRDGVRYRVVERRYAVFPQKAGDLTLPPIRFEGQARDAAGKLTFLRDREEFYTVPVKPVPASFTGDTWLPASDLTLADSGLPDALAVATGDDLTRKLVLQAQGLPSEALPPIPTDTPEGLRAYPDQPERATSVTPEGLHATLTQTVALVPIQAGELTLPEIRIPWWDTDTDSQKVAVLPARTLTVTGNAGANAVSAEAPAPSAPAGHADGSSSSGPTDGAAAGFWPWLSLALAVAWFGTLIAWRWHLRRLRPKAEHRDVGDNEQEAALYEALVLAARKGSPSTPHLLTRWVRARHPDQRLRTLSDVLGFLDNETLNREIEALQRSHFATPSEQSGNDSGDRQVLLRTLDALRRQRPTRDQAETLPPLYPDGLSA